MTAIKQPPVFSAAHRFTVAAPEKMNRSGTLELRQEAGPADKNALDWVYPKCHRKAVGFVSYGSAMGAGAAQQLRETGVAHRRSASMSWCEQSNSHAPVRVRSRMN